MATASVGKPDWRIGLKVKPKIRTHVLFGKPGVVREVYPDGSFGVDDQNGVLVIDMGYPFTFLVVEGANEWVTA